MKICPMGSYGSLPRSGAPTIIIIYNIIITIFTIVINDIIMLRSGGENVCRPCHPNCSQVIAVIMIMIIMVIVMIMIMFITSVTDRALPTAPSATPVSSFSHNFHSVSLQVALIIITITIIIVIIIRIIIMVIITKSPCSFPSFVRVMIMRTTMLMMSRMMISKDFSSCH